MIEAVNLTKEFGTFTAVDNLSLNVAEGEVLALLGPNGAGKTTTVRMLGAILQPSRGYARIAGYDTIQQAQQVRQVIGLLTEFSGLYLRMSGLDYLRFFGELQGLSPELIRHRSLELLERFELSEAGAKRVGTYSKGMKQKLSLVRALLHDPLVLFLDEPTSAMDPHSAKLVRDMMAELKQKKRTIVLCTHNLAEAEQLADRIAVIRQGRLITQGTALELKQQWLGDPIMELRLAAPLNGWLADLETSLKVVAHGPDWLRYAVPDPARSNPLLLTELIERRLPVLSLSEVSRSLEEVYLNLIEAH